MYETTNYSTSPSIGATRKKCGKFYDTPTSCSVQTSNIEGIGQSASNKTDFICLLLASSNQFTYFSTSAVDGRRFHRTKDELDDRCATPHCMQYSLLWCIWLPTISINCSTKTSFCAFVSAFCWIFTIWSMHSQTIQNQSESERLVKITFSFGFTLSFRWNRRDAFLCLFKLRQINRFKYECRMQCTNIEHSFRGGRKKNTNVDDRCASILCHIVVLFVWTLITRSRNPFCIFFEPISPANVTRKIECELLRT